MTLACRVDGTYSPPPTSSRTTFALNVAFSFMQPSSAQPPLDQELHQVGAAAHEVQPTKELALRQAFDAARWKARKPQEAHAFNETHVDNPDLVQWLNEAVVIQSGPQELESQLPEQRIDLLRRHFGEGSSMGLAEGGGDD